jgi:hypothetical protein
LNSNSLYRFVFLFTVPYINDKNQHIVVNIEIIVCNYFYSLEVIWVKESTRFKTLYIKMLKHPYLSIIIFGTIVFIMHLFITPDFADDIWFANAFSDFNNNPFSYSIVRYNTWTSRTLIELLILLCVKTPAIIWRILDTSMMIIIAVFISKILAEDKNRAQINIVVASLLMLFPFAILSSAGWIATTVNYTWSLAFGLIAIYPLSKIMRGKRIRVYEFFVYIPALLVGANQEQMFIILFAVYLIFTVYLFSKKRINKFVLVQLGLCLLSLINILICPGNANRVAAEIGRWLPQFANFSFLHRAELGLSVSLASIFLNNNLLFLLLTFFVFVLVWQKKDRIIYKVIAAVPVGFAIMFLALRQFIFSDIQIIKSLFSIGSGDWIANSQVVFSLKTYAVLLTMIFVLLTLLISVYRILSGTLKPWLAIGVLSAGFVTKFIMGFSPTIWASSERTSTFLLISIIACITILLRKWNFNDKSMTQLMLIITVLFGVYGAIVNLVFVLQLR